MKSDFDITAGLLGDSILPEPALNAYGLRNGGTVNVFVANPPVRPLYENHPVIRLADEPCGRALSEHLAFDWAVHRRKYFAEGYFPQVGIERLPEDRIHFRVHGLPARPVANRVILCPFSRSCASEKGDRGNKTVPVEWWEDVFCRMNLGDYFGNPMVVTLGGIGDPPVRSSTWNHRGIPLRAACEMILNCRLLITVETFANIVAAGKTIGKTLFMASACPDWFIAPPRAEVIRADWPDQWDKMETVDTIRRMLA